jgi:hypothetical protein
LATTVAFVPGVGWVSSAVITGGFIAYQLYDSREALTKAWSNILSSEAADGDSAKDSGGKAEEANDAVPPVPSVLVGDQSSDLAGLTKNGKRHTSGPMTPENGGTGDAARDFDKLTGNTSQPAGGTYPPGTLIGPNGVVLRPGQKGSGPRIEIPSTGSKPPETLHY